MIVKFTRVVWASALALFLMGSAALAADMTVTKTRGADVAPPGLSTCAMRGST